VGFLSRVFGRSHPVISQRDAPEAPSEHFMPLPEDNFMRVVGESHYQRVLQSLEAECIPGVEGRPSFSALLVAEPDNAFDRNAIAVYGPTGQVGYLAREDAIRYRDTFEALSRAGYRGGSCTGLLNGGDTDRPNLGVVLTLAYPEVCETRLRISPGGSHPK
jgi:hypothetical protein